MKIFESTKFGSIRILEINNEPYFFGKDVAEVLGYESPNYVQIFFDEAFGISFEKILTLISNPDLEGVDYFLESDIKNQNKTIIKICAKNEENILTKIHLPQHYSEMKEFCRGRLLFYVKFNDSVSVINEEGFQNLFGFGLV